MKTLTNLSIEALWVVLILAFLLLMVLNRADKE